MSDAGSKGASSSNDKSRPKGSAGSKGAGSEGAGSKGSNSSKGANGSKGANRSNASGGGNRSRSSAGSNRSGGGSSRSGGNSRSNGGGRSNGPSGSARSAAPQKPVGSPTAVSAAPKPSGPVVERSILDRTDRNVARSRTLALPQAVAAGVVVGLVVALITVWWLGLIAAVVSAVAVFVLLPRTVLAGLAGVFEARPATEEEFPRFHNLIEGLTVSSGVVAPELAVIDDPGINLATYGDPEHGVLVVTTGLLEALDRVELEGVLAAALARIRSFDAHLAGQAALLVCGPLVRNGPSRPGRSLGAVALLAPQRANRLHRLLGTQREFLSDLAAVDMTRYPPGLGAALEKMEQSGTAVASATWGTAHLWLADPLGPPQSAGGDIASATTLNELFGGRTPIDQRASLMAEL